LASNLVYKNNGFKVLPILRS